jgi:hypothetical protein
MDNLNFIGIPSPQIKALAKRVQSLHLHLDGPRHRIGFTLQNPVNWPLQQQIRIEAGSVKSPGGLIK